MLEQPSADILLVDRNRTVGNEIVSFLSARNYEVEWVDDGEKACNCLDSRQFDVLVTELNIRRVDGMRLMGVAQDRNPDICVIMIAEDPDIERATEAMRQGAYDFQTKPLNMGKLEAVVRRGLDHQQLLYEQVRLKRRLDERYGLANLIGKSHGISLAYNLVRQAAPSMVPVIVAGEPGTGKDLVAQAIHNRSVRLDGPFVKMNCSGASKRLLETELLGHGRNWPRGGPGVRAGRFELADQGTLYLDGVDSLPAALCDEALSILERGRVRRLGEKRTMAVDFRLIVSVGGPSPAARHTAQFLDALQKQFGAVLIELPALRFRREDVPLLADHFVRETGREIQVSVEGISRNALDVLSRYDWPGNVRELQNTVEGMVLATRNGRLLDVADVPAAVRQQAAAETGEIRIPAGTPMNEVERMVIEETMKACGYDKRLCATTLGIGLRTLYRKLSEYGSR